MSLDNCPLEGTITMYVYMHVGDSHLPACICHTLAPENCIFMVATNAMHFMLCYC